MINVVNDQGNIQKIKASQIDKKLTTDRRKTIHDSLGNACQIEDTIVISNKSSPFAGYRGIIKNICRKCIFLWDPAFLQRSNGIFVELVSNITILGHEMLVSEAAKHVPGMANTNKIGKHKLQGKTVIVIRGEMKG